MNKELKKENEQVLNLIQAMLGSVTANMRAIGIDSRNGEVKTTFLLGGETPEDQEEIEDIVFEFEALQLENVPVDVEVVVDSRPLDDLLVPWARVAFLRKE